MCIRDRITVANEPSAEVRTRETTDSSGAGYGLSGMAERAELIRAHLSTGPDDDGGWTNRLSIPYDGRSTP